MSGFNWHAIKSIYFFELHRFARTLLTGLLVPVISTSLYFVVFGGAIGSRMTEIDGIPYGAFIVPGLIMLSMFTESIFNASFGIYMPKFSGTIYELLSAPVSAVETVIAYVGVRGLALVGFVATPLYLAAAVATLAVSLPGVSASQIWNYPGVHGSTFTFGAGVTMVVATFADSGTMTGDITRWAKNGRQAVLAAATAFPVANLIAFLAGAVVVATGVIIDPAKSGGDFVPLMAHAHGPMMRLLAMAVVFIGLGSVCAHCLYNGALGWSNLLDRRMRTLCLVLGAIGTIAATAGVWNHILDWLNLLGVFVPPMGAVILVSEFLGAGRRSTLRMRAIEPTAVISYGAGALAAGVEHVTSQGFSEAVAGMVVAGVVYFVLNKVTSRRAVTPVGADQ